MRDLFSPAFLGWRHEEELNSVVRRILAGETSIRTIDDLSSQDLDYIKSKLRESGIEAEFTLD